MRTQFEFVLPRGYVDEAGAVHKTGTMRLATARDELEPLRDPRVNGPDDPRLTVLVLARVVESIGSIDYVSATEIEGLFAADLAYLQDFYGVVNFGTEADIDALLEAQRSAASPPPPAPAPVATPPVAEAAPPASSPDPSAAFARPAGRRSAIEEVPSSSR